MTDGIPRETIQVLSAGSPFIPQTFLFTSFLVALFAVAIFILFKRSSSQSKGTDLLLLGAPDAGKTSILSTLVYDQTLPAHTSLQTNSSVCVLPTKKPFRIIDVPGHPRVRNQFREHLIHAKVIAFVVDASTVSRTGAAVAEHLHLILHALTTLPPSQTPPSLLIVANKADLLRTTSSTSPQSESIAVARVKTVLERELEKRRASQSGGVAIEGLDAEDEKSDIGGLDCGDGTGVFKFDDWDGGQVSFVNTFVRQGKTPSGDEKSSDEDGLSDLRDWLMDSL